MKSRKTRMIAVAAFLALWVVLLIIYVSAQIGKLNLTEKPQRSIFSWHEEFVLDNEKSDFYTIIEYLDIDRVYQCFSSEQLLAEESENFIADLNSKKIDVYFLCGEPEWGLEDGQGLIKNAIDKVIEYNQKIKGTGTLSGIVLDIEPYLTEVWDDDKDAVVATYIENMIAAYEYAKESGLETVICIPNWLDNEYYQQLENLISKGCDVVAVMNYNRQDEEGRIQTEVELSEKYKKSIECIFEFHEVGEHGLTNNQTYADAGIDAAIENLMKLYTSFNYKRFGYSFHSYDAIHKLLND